MPSLWQRASRSWAFRSGGVYRWILRELVQEPVVPSKPVLEVPLLTMCGASHLLMLASTLYSIARYWSRLPEVTVVSDGTLPEASIERRLRWWPGGLRVVPWQSYSRHHLDHGRPALVEYAAKNGFGRKLSAVLAEAEQRRVFWCDADILFYSDFTPEVLSAPANAPVLWTTLDWCYGYDQTLTDNPLARHLLDSPPVNTGLMLIEGSFYESCGLDALVRAGMPACNGFTEQTILGEAVNRAGEIRWPLSVVDISADDIFTWGPTFRRRQFLSRHYVTSIRHLFWRDALFMRSLPPAPTPLTSAGRTLTGVAGAK